jgi:ankyrin repeat protein
MKFTEKFKEIEEPKDLDPAELNSYLNKTYNGPKFDVNDPSYMAKVNDSFRSNWNNFPYKIQADKIISLAATLSQLNEFKELKAKFIRPIDKGSTRMDAELIKSSLEAICYNLENKLQNINLVHFKNEVLTANFKDCIAGAGTNVQKVLYAMQNSLYYKKYDFLQNYANQYIKDNQLSESIGTEVHLVNEFLHEIRQDFHISPPNDTYARYRDLSFDPDEKFFRHVAFKKSLNKNKLNLVTSFGSYLANDFVSMLPEEKDLNIYEDDLPFLETSAYKALEKLNLLCEANAIKREDILHVKDDGYYYADNKQDLIEAIFLSKLVDQGYVKNELQIGNQPVVITSNSWFLVGNKEEAYNKILDTSYLSQCRYIQKNFYNFLKLEIFEDGIVETIEDFNYRLMNLTNNVQIKYPFETIEKKLMLMSDEVKLLAYFLDPEYFKTSSCSDIAENFAFAKVVTEEKIAIVSETEILLRKSVERNSYAITRCLIEKFKADPYSLHDGENLLYVAAKSNFTDHKLLNLLLDEYLLNPNVQNSQGDTALLLAIVNDKNIDFIKTLITNKNINLANKKDVAPIHIAAGFRDESIIKLLIENNANVNCKNDLGFTPLLYAAKLNKLNNVRTLICNTQTLLDETNCHGKAAVHYAIDNTNPAMLEMLLEARANVDIKFEYGINLITYAIGQESNDCLKFLAEKTNLDLNYKYNLSIALQDENLEAIKILVDRDINLNDKDWYRILYTDDLKTDIREQAFKIMLCSGRFPITSIRLASEECVLYYNNPIEYVLKNNNSEQEKLTSLKNLSQNLSFNKDGKNKIIKTLDLELSKYIKNLSEISEHEIKTLQSMLEPFITNKENLSIQATQEKVKSLIDQNDHKTAEKLVNLFDKHTAQVLFGKFLHNEIYNSSNKKRSAESETDQENSFKNRYLDSKDNNRGHEL